MAFDASTLEPRIYEILRAPAVDFESISAKRVRAQLAEEQPGIAAELREHKKAVDEIVLQAYHAVKLDRDQVHTPTATASSSAEEDDDFEDEKPPQSSLPVPLKKATKKKDVSDSEFAQQLHDQINSSGRTTRNGGGSKKKRAPASSGGGRKKYKLSEDIIEDSDEEAASGSDVKPAKKTRKRKAKRSDDDDEEKPQKKKRGGGGFNKPWTLSAEMATVCGVDHCSRPQVVKRIWDYIRTNELQNPKDKRQIKCDENLMAVMGCKTVTAFSMNKYIGKHLYPLSEGAVVAPDLEVAVKEDEKEEPLAKEEEQEDEVKTED